MWKDRRDAGTLGKTRYFTVARSVEGGRDGDVPLLKWSVHGSRPDFTPSRVGKAASVRETF